MDFDENNETIGSHTPELEKDVDEEKMRLFKIEFKSLIEAKAQKEYKKFEPLKYTQQVVVYGMMFKIKYRVDDDKIILAKVLKPLAYTGEPPECLELMDIGVAEDTPLSSLN